MKIKLFIVAFSLLVTNLTAQQINKVTLDLINSTDDQVEVEFITPTLTQDKVEFQIPKIVPGTYSISDFGRFVSDLKAIDSDGNALTVERLSDNRWLINEATKLFKITYKIDDTFDSDLGNTVFEPGGTNIEAENSLFTINTFGFIGYIKGYDKIPFELTVKHKAGLYGATSMIGKSVGAETDIFTAPNYFDLADAPILYSEPDTTTLEVGGAEILVSVFSPNKLLSSKEVMSNVKEILNAQKNYLGGKLPIKKYAFLIYLFNGQTKSGSYGALEHSYSSLYVLPEAGIDRIGQVVNDVAAHEFFHIVTPLNIHAEQIGSFNFIEPEMSEHLWMYEGVTEYSAQHVQVKYDLISEKEFLDQMRLKMFSSERFNRDLAFTEMSANVLKPEYEDQYGNVYEKGALIGMCLDLLLLNESDGKYGLQNLMQDLSKEYGKTQSFKDEELFDKIESLTYPSVRKFLDKYVGGNERLPFEEILGYAGIEFSEEKTTQVVTLGGIRIQVNVDRELVISDVSNVNDFGKAIGYEQGDVIVSINGTALNLEIAQQVIDDYTENTKEGEKVKVVVKREVKGKMKNKKLKGKAVTVPRIQKNFLELDENATEKQLAIRKAWLKP